MNRLAAGLRAAMAVAVILRLCTRLKSQPRKETYCVKLWMPWSFEAEDWTIQAA